MDRLMTDEEGKEIELLKGEGHLMLSIKKGLSYDFMDIDGHLIDV